MNKQNEKIIYLAGNSQATDVGVETGQNYPSILMSTLSGKAKIYTSIKSGWTLKEFADTHISQVLTYSPDLVIMNFGIVECAQRILSKKEKKIISYIPGSNKITAFLHKNRRTVLKLRNFLGMTTREASVSDYQKTVSRVEQIFLENSIRYLFLKIPTFSNFGNDLNHPYLESDILQFNAILAEYSSCSIENEVSNWSSAYYQNGTVHFNSLGHAKIAKFLIEEIDNRIK